MRRVGVTFAVLLVLVLALPITAQVPEPVDLNAIYKIKEEGLQRSKVMEVTGYLTDVYGPRLTNSPSYKAAAEYAKKTLAEFGLVNARFESWGPFGRSWVNERFSAHVISPTTYALIGYPLSWTPGTNGTLTGEAVLAVMQNEQDFEKFRGKLKDKFVLTAPVPEVRPQFDPQARRYTDAELEERAQQPVPVGRPPVDFAARRARQEFQNKLAKFLLDEGIAVWIEPGRGDLGTVFVGSGGSRDPKDPPVPPRVALAAEHYGRIVRTLEKKIPVTLEMNIQNRFIEDDPNSFNVIAEIPGTDKADEIVMVGGHLDGVHPGTGATDDAAGCAVMMEALRILKATGLPLRRTVRIALWSAEEQGLLGSRAYVKENFAVSDGKAWQLKPAHAKLSAYFNIDNGTGKIRGIYLQGNEAVAPIFARWMEPFHNLGMTTLSIRNTGGTDHLAFDAVGLPGFQFIQDPMDYGSRTHHSNMDVYERIQEADMKQMAVIVAAFVYHTANRPEKLPRKPLPPPQPERPRPGEPGGPPPGAPPRPPQP